MLDRNQPSSPLEETPNECQYNLTMFDMDGAAVQEHDLTREEFNALKQSLATLRGLETPVSENVETGQSDAATEPAPARPVLLARPHQDVITQAELRNALDLENRKEAALLKLRARMEAGAAVEQGPLTAELDLRAQPIGKMNPMPFPCIGAHLENWGVYVCPTEWSAEALERENPGSARARFLSPARVSLPKPCASQEARQ